MIGERENSLGQWVFLRIAVATLVVSAGVILLSLAAENVAKGPLYACLVAQYIGIGGGYLAMRLGAPRSKVQAMEMILDVGLITVCVHFTGGIGSEFALLYFFPILLAAFNLRQQGAVGTAILSAGAILSYALLASYGVVRPPEIIFKEALVDRQDLLQVHFAVALFLITGYLSGELAQRIDAKARQLAGKREELAQHRLEIQGILDNMSSGILTLDERGRARRLNPAAGSILGIDTEQIEGRPIEETLAPIMPTLVGYLVEALRDGTESRRIELNIMRQDTTVVPIGLSISQHDGSDGGRGIIAVFQDLTEVLRMRERVRASDRLAAVGELSAGIAHEIRNPLASIRGSVELLSAELSVGGENARLMALILKESERLNRIIEDFLEYARMRPLAARNCHLHTVLEEMVTMMRNRDDLGGVPEIDVIAAPADVIVEVDEEQMTQVFLNLALNAFQAMQEAGPLTISVGVRPDEQPVSVCVRFLDEGTGIAEDCFEHLFDPFFTTKSEGTGLGLSMANRIVHNHGGRIEANNLDGGGAEFTVVLPLVGIWRGGVLVRGSRALEELVVA